MSDDPIDRRLATAAGRLTSLRPRLESGGPWPLATRIDHSPEASWGPRETLAHLEEMLAFWLGETERILDGTEGGPPPIFGRQATEAVRLAIIERDRTLPIRELCARVEVGIDRWRRRWAELDEAARSRTGSHVTRGDLSLTELVNRFVVDHLDEHLDQLAESTDRGSTGS